MLHLIKNLYNTLIIRSCVLTICNYYDWLFKPELELQDKLDFQSLLKIMLAHNLLESKKYNQLQFFMSSGIICCSNQALVLKVYKKYKRRSTCIHIRNYGPQELFFVMDCFKRHRLDSELINLLSFKSSILDKDLFEVRTFLKKRKKDSSEIFKF